MGFGWNGIGNLKLSMVEAHPAESNIIFYYFIILLQARTASVFTVYFSTGSDHKLQAFKTSALLGQRVATALILAVTICYYCETNAHFLNFNEEQRMIRMVCVGI